jgi:hypothetical protein
MSDWWNQPTVPAHEPESPSAEPSSACPWCAQPAAPEAGYCGSCGAVLAQNEDLGGLVIPGVTAVDPAMQARSYTSSLSGAQSRMSTLNLVGRVGGPTAKLALAAAMLVADEFGGKGGSVDPEEVGKPSQAALEMAQRLRQPAEPATQPNAADLSAAPADGPTARAEEPTAQTGEPRAQTGEPRAQNGEPGSSQPDYWRR